jgi:hypothetical protein
MHIKLFFEAQLWSVASARTWKGTSKRETRRKNWIQVEIDQPSEVENITHLDLRGNRLNAAFGWKLIKASGGAVVAWTS